MTAAVQRASLHVLGPEFALLYYREGTTVTLCYVVAVPAFGSATSRWARYAALTAPVWDSIPISTPLGDVHVLFHYVDDIGCLPGGRRAAWAAETRRDWLRREFA